MSIVDAANEAFLEAIKKARRALHTTSIYAVAVNPEGDGCSTILVVDTSSGDPRRLKTIRKEESVPIEDVPFMIKRLLPGVLGCAPIVLLNQKIPPPALFRRHWLLVESDTLQAKRVDGQIVEALFNPT